MKSYFAGTNEKLLPNLHKFEAFAPYSAGLDSLVLHRYLDVFLTPDVQDVSLLFGDNPLALKEDVLRQALSELQRCAPELRSLSIEYREPEQNSSANTMIGDALGSFRHLTSFTADVPITPPALLHLAQLPELRSLKLALRPDNVAALQTSGQSNLFPALRELAVTDQDSLSVCLAVFQHVSSPELRAVSLEFRGEQWAFETVVDAIAAVGSRPYAEVLTSVTISSGPFGRHIFFPITSHMLKPLYSLPSLTELVLSINCDYDIDDGTLDLIGRTWPHLRRLELGFDDLNRVWREPKVSLSSLADLARACPKLEVLRIGVDTTKLPPAPASAPAPIGAPLRRTPRPPAHPLRTLRVGWSEIQDPVPVAGFLSDTFPRLRTVNTAWLIAEDFEDMPAEMWEDEDEEPRLMWDEVTHDLLPALAAVREQEWNWARAQKRGQHPA